MPRGRKAAPPVKRQLQGAPTKPDYLDAIASKEWDRIISLLAETDNLSVVDGGELAIYCQAFSKWVQCEKQIGKQGLWITLNNGCTTQAPWADRAG